MNRNITIPNDVVISKILFIRGKKVMLDKDLALLYQVSTKVLNQAVKRNIERFPTDFMFRLSLTEIDFLVSQNVIPQAHEDGSRSRSQIVTLNRGQNIKYLPYAFTEQGVAMLSSVLNSPRAIQVNIQIIRTFTKLREILADNKKLAIKIEKIERKYDKHIFHIFEVLKKLTTEEVKPKEPIGFSRE